MTSKEIAQVLRDDAEQLTREAAALKIAAHALDPRGKQVKKSTSDADQGPGEREQGEP